MPPITAIPPEILRDRHRLSSQQVNALFGRQVIEESLEEKAKALGKVAEFLKVTDALTAAGIRFIPLKGPLLSFRLYGDVTYRYFRDLDILIDASDIDGVRDILEADGYRAIERPWPEGIGARQRLLKYHHDIPFTHPDKQIMIELHWRLRHRQWPDVSEADRHVKNNLTSFPFAGRSFQTLNNEMELLYLVIHGGLHHWGRLKWLVDVCQYLKSQKINWDHFIGLSDSFNAGHLVALCNKILSEYFPGEALLPCTVTVPGYMVRFSEMRIKEADYVDNETWWDTLRRLRFSMAVYPGFSYRLRFVKSIIFDSGLSGRIGRLLMHRSERIAE